MLISRVTYLTSVWIRKENILLNLTAIPQMEGCISTVTSPTDLYQ
ncbi:hypothetical protein OAP77_00335 [Planctomycetota bacterium]|nr:hypothetical protein [Planctomycetota bacterium]